MGGDLARILGRAALGLADEPEDLQLAQIHFQNRRGETDLAAFVEYCQADIEAGHTGSFYCDRLAALYEYRGKKKEAIEICHRAIEVLEAVGNPRSATRFRKRLDRLSRE